MKSRKTSDPSRRRRVLHLFLGIFLAAVTVGPCVAGYLYLRRYVAYKVAFPADPPAVVLKNRPAWMSDFLAGQIAASVSPSVPSSAMDRTMLVNAVDMLQTNPWVRQVRQVRRAYGQKPGDTLEIDCLWRDPVALVHWGNYYWLVDGEGVMLPEQYTSGQLNKIIFGQDGRMNIRLIEGVSREAPLIGQTWEGRDLQAGLELAKLLYGRDYAEQILSIDVSNFQGRRDTREAQIVLHTRFGTDIRWGRPLDAKDAFVEVSAARKLQYLEQIFNEYRRIDANRPWIDIRFDKVTYPSPEPPTAKAD